MGVVDSYEVTYSPADGTPEPPFRIEATDPLERRVDNLRPGTDYTFFVKAVAGQDARFRESVPVQAVFRTGERKLGVDSFLLTLARFPSACWL